MVSVKLKAIASWLENPNNEILSDIDDDIFLDKVAEALVICSDIIKKQASELEAQEIESNQITSEKLEDIAKLAEICEKSQDEFLNKQASVLDELLFTFAAPKGEVARYKKKEEDRINSLKDLYENPKKSLDSMNNVEESVKQVEKSKFYKQYRPMEAALSTRYCPDHAGVPVERIADDVWQCSLDKKVYDHSAGFKTEDGKVVPGTSVANQTFKKEDGPGLFDTREERLSK